MLFYLGTWVGAPHFEIIIYILITIVIQLLMREQRLEFRSPMEIFNRDWNLLCSNANWKNQQQMLIKSDYQTTF